MLNRLARPGATLLLLCWLESVGCAKAPASGSAASNAATNPEQQASAAELYRQANDTLASVPAGNVQALVSYLEAPNPYLRAGALTRLTPHAPRLSIDAVRRVIERLDDPDPITAAQCLRYESSRRAVAGQGMMFVAAECAHNHPVTISELAAAVLAKTDPGALAKASAIAVAADRNLISELEPLVRSRETGLTAPLERVLVDAEKGVRSAEVDAALALLANAKIGVGAAETIGALAHIEERSDNARALQAVCVSLTLTYPGAGQKLSARASAGYARLADALRGTCRPGSPCPTPSDVLAWVRQMRAAAAPLLSILMSFLDTQDEFLRLSALMALTSMGEAARPAIPKVRSLLTQSASPEGVDGYSMIPLLDVIGAAHPAPRSVTPAIMTAVRRYPRLFDSAAAVLVSLKATLGPTERRVLRSAYAEACDDAGSIANFSFGRDERCFLASENLKQLKALHE